MATSGQYGYKRDAIRVKVMKYEERLPTENKKFSVDPQITSFEVLQSFLAKAFDIRGEFTVCYKILDDYGQETYLALLSDWDLDAAFISASDPYLDLRVDVKPFAACCEEYDSQGFEHDLVAEIRQAHRLPGIIMNKFELVLRTYFFIFRKVVWKHLLNVYPEGMSGKERMDYMKKKAAEYKMLRDNWKSMLYKNEEISGDLAYVTSMVRKDVLRTDRHHVFYAGSDDNKNIVSLFNILTTYALNHPAVSYCQGMSDLASPLLVTMNDEAHAYICFCALMRRLSPNFLLDGITMTKRFQHLAEGLQYFDPVFHNYLKSQQADDLLFCYRWLLLEMKREFAFEDALRMLEVMWSSVPSTPPKAELPLSQQSDAEVSTTPTPAPMSPRPPTRETPYTKVCALRRQSSSASLSLDGALAARSRGRLAKQPKARPYCSMDDSQLTNANENTKVIKNLNEFLSFDKGGSSKSRSPDNPSKKKQNVEDDSSPEEPATYHNKPTFQQDSNARKENGERVPTFEQDSKTRKENGERSSPEDSSEFYPMTTSMTRELRLELESLDRQVFGNEKQKQETAVNCLDDVFVWENPLRVSTTPDEQVDLEYDSNAGEIFETEGNSVKSVTPIKLLRKTTSQTSSNSSFSESSCSTNDGRTKSLLERRKGTLAEVKLPIDEDRYSTNGNVEEATEVSSLRQPRTGSLPPPHEFGGGNPFLMFLCITVLQQHRDFIMNKGMDYNEMAMHFDKMVRKHNVTKVLNQARSMYADYMKQFDKANCHLKA
ncbi:TBC1 domain family member 25 [Nilaparvata lugens]|uniref:TBC1 domain family member 25 n=1 Tax=Nilaparvata lugens TaxID=108931 RepID=UPI00193CE311|nr:TBC1 domain family member 25 [Nilaparvata lugens]